MTRRQRLAQRLRFLADRIDHHGAPKCMSALSFTYELNVGMVVHIKGPAEMRHHADFDHLPGCPLWYYGDDDFELSWTESESAKRL